MTLLLEERKLIQQLVSGHTSAWRDFVDRYQRLVASGVRQTAIQCQFNLNSAEFEDICAEVFSSLIINDFRSLRQFRGKCRISTWLMVISRRVCLGQLSRIRRANDVLKNLDRKRQYANGDLLSGMIKEEQHEEIRCSVKQLNEKDRLLLDLYFDQQLSYIEIGKQAGISVNSVGPKLNRAIVRLRKIVSRE